MNERIIIALNINKILYKFFSIIFSESDSSFYIYQHLINEKSPITVAEPFHMLKTRGEFYIGNLKTKNVDYGDQTKLSVHPKRIYLKKRTKGGKVEHLVEEFETEKFINKRRLHAFLVPPPPSYMPIWIPNNKKGKTLIFDWDEIEAPQVEIYELQEGYNLNQIGQISPGAIKYELLKSDGLHPNLVLVLQRSVLNPPVWKPMVNFFGRSVKKKSMSKTDLQNILNYNGLNYDISSIPDNSIINNIQILREEKKGPLVLDSLLEIKDTNLIIPENIEPPDPNKLNPNEVILVNKNTKEKMKLADYLNEVVKNKEIIEYIKTKNKTGAISSYHYRVPCDEGVGYITSDGKFYPLVMIKIVLVSVRKNYKTPRGKLKKNQRNTILGAL